MVEEGPVGLYLTINLFLIEFIQQIINQVIWIGNPIRCEIIRQLVERIGFVILELDGTRSNPLGTWYSELIMVRPCPVGEKWLA